MIPSGSMRPFVCQDVQSDPLSDGIFSVPVYSMVRNWFAAVRRQKKNANFVQKNEPGVDLS
jgi:hypothetical protein